MEGSATGPEVGLCLDIKPTPVLKRRNGGSGKQSLQSSSLDAHKERGINIMELCNKGICQNRQQNLKPPYLKNLQGQVTFISQFSQKWHEEAIYL